jgi:RNA polymerase sigma-70 factor, ECF subfamily
VSSQPPGRALTLPIAWGRNLEPPNAVSETLEDRCLSDEEVMVRLQARDSTALHILFDRYSRLVLSIARGILHDFGEAEDLVQDVFFYVHKKAMLFDASKGSARTWIVQMAFHRALDRKSHLARRGFYRGTEIGSLGDTLLGATDLDREIGAKLNRVQLEKAFEELPKMQRRTLELFFFEGLELREISEKLNEPLGNSRHHFYRGLERLRKSAFVQRLRGTSHDH